MNQESLLPTRRSVVDGLLIISVVMAATGWIANYFVDAFAQSRGLSAVTAGQLHLACSVLGLGVVLVGPFWIYRQLRRWRNRRT
jgi:hypothetical protein